jgi:hypothetical protein|tara:strand:- start:189 stop:701 length:513 start_codon:yes stop_codon:yes gene_type:complete
MWEDILKRRPLKISKPGEDEDAILSDIKNKIIEFLIKKEIMSRYTIDLGRANNREEKLVLDLEGYFNSIPQQDSAKRAIQIYKKMIQNGELSLLFTLRQLKRGFGMLRKKFLLREDLIASAKIVEEIDNILSRDMYVLIEQDRPFAAERQQGYVDYPDNPTYPPLPENPW